MFHSFLGLSLHLLAFLHLGWVFFYSSLVCAWKKYPKAAFTSKLSIFMLHRGLFSLAYLSQMPCSILMSKRNFPLKYHPIICRVWLAMYLKSKLKKKCQAWETWEFPPLYSFSKIYSCWIQRGKWGQLCVYACAHTQWNPVLMDG